LENGRATLECVFGKTNGNCTQFSGIEIPARSSDSSRRNASADPRGSLARRGAFPRPHLENEESVELRKGPGGGAPVGNIQAWSMLEIAARDQSYLRFVVSRTKLNENTNATFGMRIPHMKEIEQSKPTYAKWKASLEQDAA